MHNGNENFALHKNKILIYIVYRLSRSLSDLSWSVFLPRLGLLLSSLFFYLGIFSQRVVDSYILINYFSMLLSDCFWNLQKKIFHQSAFRLVLLKKRLNAASEVLRVWPESVAKKRECPWEVYRFMIVWKLSNGRHIAKQRRDFAFPTPHFLG